MSHRPVVPLPVDQREPVLGAISLAARLPGIGLQLSECLPLHILELSRYLLLTYISEAIADNIVHMEITLLGIFWCCRHYWGVERRKRELNRQTEDR